MECAATGKCELRTISRWWLVALLSATLLISVQWKMDILDRLDFHIYVEAVRYARHFSLYDYRIAVAPYGFTYPPFAAVALWPIAHLPTALAEHVWLVATVLAAGALSVVATKTAPRRCPTWAKAGIVAASLWTMPVVLTARLGQINTFVALLVGLEVVAWRRGSRTFGVATGIAAALKLTPGLLILYWLYRGHRRPTARALAAFLVATVSALIVYRRDSQRYWTHILFDTDRVGRLDHPFNTAMRRIITWMPIGGAAQTGLWLGVSLLVVTVAFRRAASAERYGNHLAAVTLVMLSSYLVSPVTWGHHLMFIIPALVLIIGDGRSMVRLAGALVVAIPFFDWWERGEGHITPIVRMIVLLVLTLVALPIDRQARHVSPQPTPIRSMT